MPSQNRQERIMERTWEEKKTKLLAQWIADLRETAKIDINEGLVHIGRHGYDTLPLRHAERRASLHARRTTYRLSRLRSKQQAH
jgi:hypothetical protein